MPYKKGRSLVAAVLMVSLLGGGPVFLTLPGVAAAGNAVVDKKAMKQADWQLAEAYGRPARWSISSASAIPILS